uniref:dolichol kinase n=1 Tax=Rhodnius prolixus TaxID=13249 RepID=T1HXV3_RHOPR
MKFADEKDEGPVALTPVYLLVGCALPLWLYPVTNISESDILPLISGLLTVGVGDSAASICGSLVGKNKWPGSKKTKEGTAACFLSQLFLVIALIQFDLAHQADLWYAIFFKTVISTIFSPGFEIVFLSKQSESLIALAL